jgi:DNA-directed RNA polymerase specialized sigma24 family protein
VNDSLDAAAAPYWPTFRDDPGHWATRGLLSLAYLPIARDAAAVAHLLHDDAERELLDADDVQQLAWFCLIELLGEYDARAACGFAAWATTKIHLRIRAAVARVAFLREAIGGGPDVEDPADLIGLCDVREWLTFLRGTLGDARLELLFDARFVRGLSIAETAAVIGVDESLVSRQVTHELLPLVCRRIASMRETRGIADGVATRLREHVDHRRREAA